MRRFLSLLLLFACAGAPEPPDTDVDVDTATDDPVCPGFGEACAALPPRPAQVSCLAAFREAGSAEADVVWPDLLSDLGCFTSLDPLVAADGVLPYAVAAPLFSEGSDKGRWLVLAPGATVTPAAEGLWTFPVGTGLLKAFARPPDEGGLLVEVRVMWHASDGWAFRTYAWDGALGDARLVPERGRTVAVPAGGGDEPWYFPSVDACRSCHRVPGAEVLGVTTAQLNHRVDHGAWVANQLVAWDAVGVFTPSIATLGALPRLADPRGSADVASRARAWLQGNCAHCHQPGGFAPPEMTMDLRASVPLAETATCRVRKDAGWLTPGEVRIAPGDPEGSHLWQRVRTTTYEKMPPDGGLRYDDEGIETLRQWIAGMEGCDDG